MEKDRKKYQIRRSSRIQLHGDNGCKSAFSAANAENISAKKLVNTSFEKFECKKEIMTHRNAREVGLGSTSDVKVATGFKIQDASLLSECISDAAICSSCKTAGL